MANDFADLKRSRKTSLKSLIDETTKLSSSGAPEQNEERFWKPTVDKAENGYAVIRFLPAAKGDELPWVRGFNHGFQGTGGWYIENSLTTLGKKDPVSEYNSLLWNSGIESNKEQVRKQKRRLTYISNIFIVNDPGKPENNGKVFLFKYGKKIWDKINDAMNPSYEDEAPVNPFDFWEGANFKLKIRKVEGYRNYDKSEFEAPSALASDEEMEEIWTKQHPLAEYVDAKNFKFYEELQAKLNRVLGLDGSTASASKSVEDVEDNYVPTPTPSRTAPAKTVKEDDDPPWAEEEDDGMSFFEKLAKDD